MNVLVTGGAGYIGSVVAAELIKTGHHVIIYDNLARGYRAAVPTAAEFVHADIADQGKLADTLKRRGVDAVMHFAAFLEVGESMQVPEKYFRNNTASTLMMLETMLNCGVQRFVFSSTAALFGQPEHIPIRETEPLKPASAYGASKHLVEQALEWLHRLRGIRYASLRYFNASGAAGDLGESHNPEIHLIPLMLHVALGKRESISIFGTDYPTPDGTCIRDYVHVLDLASAHLLALEALDARGQMLYNLGNGRGFSVRQVLDVARRITGHPIPAVEAPRRPGDPAELVASSEKIQKELNWQPRYAELETIVRTAWDWHRAHPNGYER